MSLEIDPHPLCNFSEMLTGYSAKSVSAFIDECSKDQSKTRHMVIDGDATDCLDLIPDESIDLVVTSIPYESLVQYGVEAKCNAGLASAEFGHEEDEDEHKLRLYRIFLNLKKKLNKNGSIAIVVGNPRVGGRGKTGPNGIPSKNRRVGMQWRNKKMKSLIRLTDLVATAGESAGLLLRNIEIWNKPHCKPESVKDRSRQTHEYVLIFQKTKNSKCVRENLTANGLQNDKTVFECPVTRATYGHPATFNPLLPERYIVGMTEPGDVVLDFMGGIGSTGLAALKHARNSITIELYPDYCEIAKQRLLHFAQDFKAEVNEPASLEHDETTEITSLRLLPSATFRPMASDVRFMSNYGAIPRPTLLKGSISDYDDQKLESFPIECLPNFQRELLEDLILCFNANEAVAATCILTTWSNSIATGWKAFDRKLNVFDYPILQSLIAMPSGLGKSIASKITEPHFYFEKVLARITRLKGRVTDPCLTCDSATKEALVEQLAQSQEVTFLFSSEAGGQLTDIISAAQGGNGNIFDLLLKGFSRDKISCRTKKDGRLSLNPSISMLLLAQPDLVKQLLQNKFFKARGLANRWLLLEIPEPEPVFDTGIIHDSDRSVHRRWHECIRNALFNRLLSENVVINHTWSNEALEVFRQYDNKNVDRITKNWGSHRTLLRRSRELHKRIALCLLAAEYYSGFEDVLKNDEEVAIRSGIIAEWFDRRRVEFFEKSHFETLKQLKMRVIDILTESPDHAKTVRDMERRNGISKNSLSILVKNYPRVFQIRKIKPEGKGRPSDVLMLRWVK